MKYFVVSDIHSFAMELIEALNKAGFRKSNKEHVLIVCGDIFDRGTETMEVYKFLKSIPKKRCILIKGNHESLYFDLLKKSFPDSYDFSNHTVDTFCHIAGYSAEIMEPSYWYKLQEQNVHERISQTWKEIVKEVKDSPVTAWLKSAQWKNYYELDKYIFVHSFIPVKIQEKYAAVEAMYGTYNLSGKAFEYWADWRNANDYAWEEASWGDPIDRYLCELFKPESDNGKVLVVGHWHTGDFYSRISNIRSYDEPIHEIWFGKDFIGLDGGVFRDAITRKYIHPQNVLVIDSDDFSVCHDKYGAELQPVKSVRRIETVTITDEKE